MINGISVASNVIQAPGKTGKISVNQENNQQQVKNFEWECRNSRTEFS